MSEDPVPLFLNMKQSNFNYGWCEQFFSFDEILFFLFILPNKYQWKSLKRRNKISTIVLQLSFKQKG